ncbi:DNA-directed RNA polymerase II subunit RPB11 [Rhynchospora pubera]|uniref:DNA-directed RNA polymerase II subunit RPB11 n=1 Tax=Rhynchospora pubera TaxID=906938 RepID=A0AAV8APU9_9POAL|nr:DNA-directed RNA polymerase II subunit RPB11 [Rhynchospora pubera]
MKACQLFSVIDEDHTLANSVRFVLNQDPRVSFCGYSIPHPSDNNVNIRVQTTGDSAKDVLKDALHDLVQCASMSDLHLTHLLLSSRQHNQLKRWKLMNNFLVSI